MLHCPGGRAAALTLGLALAASGTLAAPVSVTLTPDQAAQVAEKAFLSKNYVLSEQIARGLVARNPKDVGALLLLSASEAGLGRPQTAYGPARRAYALAGDPRLRYQAARLAGKAAADQGRFALAQFWLRRSVDVAGSQAQKDQSIRDFRLMRMRDPWRMVLDASIAPSSNINGGANSSLLTIAGVPYVGLLNGPAQALSGTQERANLTFSYRLSGDARKETQLVGRTFATFNQLSRAAQALAPGSKGSDFNYLQTEAGVKQTFLLGASKDINSVAVNAGQSWYGGAPYDQYVRLDLQRFQNFSPTWGMWVSATVTHNEMVSVARNDAMALGVDLVHRMPDGDLLTTSLGAQQTTSQDDNQVFYGGWAGLSYAVAKPIGPVRASASVMATTSRYPNYSVIFTVPGGRVDKSVVASVNFELTKPSFWGFAPVISLTDQRSFSNVSRFQTANLGVGLSIKSQF
jgi:hypothetical protein